MLEKFDAFIAGALHVPLKFLCKLTGRSNYFFAITTMILSVLIHAIYYSNRILTGKFDFSDGFFWPFVVIVGVAMIRLFHNDRRRVGSGPDTISLSQFNYPNWVLIRSLLVGLNTFNLTTAALSGEVYAVLPSTASLLWVIAVYFAADTMPRGKGWLQKIAKRIVTSAKKPIKLPSLNPAPPPIPS